MTGCIFCEIINLTIPSWVVYEDQKVISFLPTAPEVYGHTIIAPKQHFADIYNAPESVLAEILIVSKKLAVHYQNQIGSSGINLLHASGTSAQQSVFHLHVHLIPRFEKDGLNAWPVFPSTSFNKDEMVKKLAL